MDQDSNNQVITIDSEISRILGLQDNFDLDSDEYLQLIREKLAQFDILSASKNITSEQQEEQRLLATQVREIREQKRKGNIQYKTGRINKGVNKDSFFGTSSRQSKEPEKRIVDPSRLLPGTAKAGEIVKYKSQKVEDLKGEKAPEDNKELTTIQKILNSILDTLKNRFKFDQKKTEGERKDKEIERRKKKESNLEKGFAMVKSAVSKMLAPVQSILDQIWKYFLFTFLGKMFMDLMNWLSDPENKSKVEALSRFLKDWWPLLLGAYLLFGTPLGLFVRGTLKLIGGFTKKILGLLPRLLKVSKGLLGSAPARAIANVARSPLFLIPATAIGTAAILNELTGQRKAAPIQAENRARAQTGRGIGVQGTGTAGEIQRRTSPSPGDMGPTTPYGLLQGANLGGIVKNLFGHSNGAAVLEDGYGGIDNGTGIPITGAGRDTQLIAARPGEVVLTPEDATKIQKTTGFDVYGYVKNRKPSYTNFNKIKMYGQIPLANAGGLIGFNKGGIVGGNAVRMQQGGGNVVRPPSGSSSPTPILDLGRRLTGDSSLEVNPTLRLALPLMYNLLQSGRFKKKGWGTKNFLDFLTSRLLVESGNFSKIREQYDSSPSDPSGKPGYNYFQSYRNLGGNMSADDAYNFRGRGPIQLTGRELYSDFNKWLARNGYKGYDVVGSPDLLASNPKVAALSTLFYLENRERLFKRDLGVDFARYAREGDIESFSRHIQGADIGIEETAENLRRIRGLSGGVNYGQGFSSPQLGRQRSGGRPQRPNIMQSILSGASNSLGSFFGIPSGNSRSNKPDKGNRSQTRRPKRWGIDPRGWFGMQGGGALTPVTTRTGIDIPGGRMGADTQLLPQHNVAVQPGEQIFSYVIPKDAADKGVGKTLLQIANNVVGNADSNSSAAKIGFRNRDVNIRPPISRMGGASAMTLPPITAPSSGGMKGSPAANSQDIYRFSPVLETSFEVRKMFVDMYGIID